VGDRPDGSGWAAVALTDDAQERLGGPAWFDLAARDRVVGALYPLYREPGRHVVAALAPA
jgi:ribosomal protein S12 methylthiotransferase accessory factor